MENSKGMALIKTKEINSVTQKDWYYDGGHWNNRNGEYPCNFKQLQINHAFGIYNEIEIRWSWLQ